MTYLRLFMSLKCQVLKYFQMIATEEHCYIIGNCINKAGPFPVKKNKLETIFSRKKMASENNLQRYDIKNLKMLVFLMC